MDFEAGAPKGVVPGVRTSQETTATAADRTKTRLTSVDALRGLVMIIMALDHTRDFIHAGAMTFAPDDLTRTTPVLFFTRWMTHLCAPAFAFLAGAGILLRLQRSGSKSELARFLWTRGAWLVLIELTVMRLGMNFSLGPPYPVLLLVLTSLGASMVLMAGLIYVPMRPLAVLSAAVIVLHNTLDGVRAADLGPYGWLWTLFFRPGVFVVGSTPIVVGYPVLPWTAVMATGFCVGPVLLLAADRRRRLLAGMGTMLIVMFAIVRAINVYGDPRPWSPQASPLFTLLSFLNTTKYPPSFEFILMTLGPALLLLAYLDRRPLGRDNPLIVFGRVPFLYYVAHFWAIHLLSAFLSWVRYGQQSLSFLFHPLPSMGGPRELFPAGFGYPLWVVYAAWAAIVVAMYPLCRWFARVKSRRKAWWVSYL